MQRDGSLDSLLGLNNIAYVLDAADGLVVRFDVSRVTASETNPHGVEYQFNLFGPLGERFVGFENSRQMRAATFDHIQRLRSVRAYAYRDAATLLEDFWDEIDAWLRARAQ